MKGPSRSNLNREERKQTRQDRLFVEGSSKGGKNSSRRPMSKAQRDRPTNSLVHPDEEYTQMPWLELLPKGKNYHGVEQRLHHEILAYVNYMNPTTRENAARENVLSRVKRVVQGRFRNAEVRVFGSSATGLGLPDSDIDIAVEIPSVHDVKDALFQLSSRIKSSGLTSTRVVVNHRARAPIISFTTRGEYGSFKVDIGINNPNSIEGIEVTKKYLSEMPALQPLILVMKSFLRQRNLNDAGRGGLGSYGLVCLCISFLQLNPGKRHPDFIAKPMETESLGALLTDFMFYYGFEFPHTTSCISVSEGKLFPKAERSESLSIFCLINHEKDISKSVANMKPLILVFKEGYAAILQLTNVEENMLGKLVGLSRKTIRHRDFISELADVANSDRPPPYSSWNAPRAPYVRKQTYGSNYYRQ